jgi:hypothetical protein
MAELYLNEIRAIQPQGPYLIGGYCFGGLVAFEMAHRLVTMGEKIACLILIGTHAPRSSSLPSPGVWLRRHLEALKDLPLRERPAYIIRRFANIPLVIGGRLRVRLHRHIWQIYAFRGWRPPVRLQTPEYVCEIAGSRYEPPVLGNVRTVIIAGRPRAVAPSDPYHGWNDRMTHGFRFCDLDASVTALMVDPGIRELAQELRNVLEEADGKSSFVP